MKFSIVIAGPVTKWTNLLIESARRYYPNSQIIFSTWSDQDLSLCKKVDDVVINDETKLIDYNNHQHFSNVFYSSLNGLNLASERYSLRVRSDLRFIKSSFVEILEQKLSKTKKEEFSLFKEKIRCVDLGSLMQKSSPLYFADICQGGLTEDLIKFFDVELVAKNVRKFEFLMPNSKDKINPKFDIGNEHAVPLMCIKKHLNFTFLSPSKFADEEEKNIHDKILVNNFVLLDMQTQHGLAWDKYPSYGRGCDVKYYNRVYDHLVGQ